MLRERTEAKVFVALAMVAFAACVWALTQVWAQQLAPTGLNGNETWSVATGGPGGPSLFVTTNLMRNTQSYVLNATTTGAVQAPANVVGTIFTAALTGGVTFTAPVSPYDGQKVAVTNGTTGAFAQTITFTASGTQTVVNGAAVATLGVGATAAWIYTAATNSWYRIQ